MVSLRYSASLWRYPASPLSLHAWRGIVAVFGFAVVVFCFALISSHLAWYLCGIRLRSGGILLRPYLFMPGIVSLRYSASLWRYPASPLSLHTWHGIFAVFGFAVEVSCFALISSHLAWYLCGIRLRCGGILLRPYLLTPGMVSLRYLASLWRYSALPWRYPASPLSLHAWRGIVAVFGFAVALFSFALIFFMSSMVSLRYLASLWRYLASP